MINFRIIVSFGINLFELHGFSLEQETKQHVLPYVFRTI